MKRLVEECFTRQIIRDFGEDYRWIEFKFKDVKTAKDRLDEAKIHEIYVGTGIMTVDEIREDYLER